MIKVHKSEVAAGEVGPTRPVGAATEAPNGIDIDFAAEKIEETVCFYNGGS